MQQAPTILNVTPAGSSVETQVESHTQYESVAVEFSDVPVVGQSDLPVELGGRDGPEPTRFGDWEKAGRCIDF